MTLLTMWMTGRGLKVNAIPVYTGNARLEMFRVWKRRERRDRRQVNFLRPIFRSASCDLKGTPRHART